ncbi:unnamed protein product [Mycena citricolor]|uniref:BTB domain-containing protein n=1 Tax=Mycena citricolor TaxID=2018698 RepID=A0AAD2HCM5_9AGAR|nr:unnamed protein product [Mycena citricolor]
MDISSDADSLRPTKRRRGPGYQSECPLNRPSMDKHLWLPDGDIVLRVEGCGMRVHRRILRCSSVFGDMFSLPQPSHLDVEQVDGCASVTLAGDKVHDWDVALKWLYEKECVCPAPHTFCGSLTDPPSNNLVLSAFLAQIVTFDTIAGALRLGTKYDMEELRGWAIAQLLLRWPEDVAEMRLTSLPHAAEAIALARECSVARILPAAFYALSVQKFSTLADGGRSHCALSPPDLRRLLAGREALQDVLLRILIEPLTEPGCPASDNSSCGQCAARRSQYIRAKFAPEACAKAPWGPWLVRELEGMVNDDVFLRSLCSDCVHAHLTTARWRLGRLRCDMVAFFLL